MSILKNHLLFLLLLLFFFEGCIPSKPTEDIDLLPSERLINKLEANRRKIRNFEGIGTLKIESAEYNNNATFQVIMQKPDSIYFSILGPFGIELVQAQVTKDEYIFYDALHNTAYVGGVDDDVLKNIFKINLSFSDLLDAFVGSVNLTSNLYKQPDAYSVEGDKYVLTYFDKEKQLTYIYRVDIRELGITYFSLTSADQDVHLEGNYSDFELIENVAIPFQIEIENKITNEKIMIDYKDIIANRSNVQVRFVLPDDADIIEW